MSGQLDVKFLKPFVDGTLNTLKIQCQLEATTEKPYIKGKQPQPEFEIAAVIGITSNAFNGTITLLFPEKVYLTLMSNMLGETFTEITSDLQDGAAELLNIIFGGAKVALSNQGYSVQKAIPTVVRGKLLQTTHLGSAGIFVLPFTTTAGVFHIEIGVDAGTM